MDWALAAWGVAIGVAVAAPIGPINLMCIQQTLGRGFPFGVMTGLGAVLGDGSFAAVAAFGITAISSRLIAYAVTIQIVGGLVLIAIGIRTLLTPPMAARPGRRARIASHMSILGSTYFLTVTNPATMLAFAAIFGGFGNLVSRPGDYGAAALLVAAVMLGSLLWWVLLSWFVSLFKARLSERSLRLVNAVSGLTIAVFGAAGLGRVMLA